jgi:hypothetical protein
VKYGIGSRVLFTYKCRNCDEIYPSVFQDSITVCKACNKPAASMANVGNGATDEQLNLIYNLFDVYVQLANSEGYGMPTCEAAACGVPVCVTNYSAMTDFVDTINAFPITVDKLNLEIETGCYRAIPNIDSVVENLELVLGTDDVDYNSLCQRTYIGFQRNYSSWDNTASKWMRYFDSIDYQRYEDLWNSPVSLRHPQHVNEQIAQSDNTSYVYWLMEHVLCEPDKIGSYMSTRMIRDLTCGVTIGGMSGMYYNENSSKFSNVDYKEFNRKIAYEHCLSLCNRYNNWESQRV